MVDGLAILAGSKPLFGGNIQFVPEPKIKYPVAAPSCEKEERCSQQRSRNEELQMVGGIRG
jgi:hypothetical protein